MKDKNHKCCNPITDTSVLVDVKKYLGPSINYTVFDMDIIMNINAAFFVLFELGVGPTDEVFTISGNSELWSEFSESKTIIAATKQYVFLKVKNTFDPPTSSYVQQAYDSQIQELEWRLRELVSGMLDSDEEDKDDCCCCHCGGGHKPEKPDDGDSSNSSYTLPPATTETLGGVIVGDNIEVDEEGRISIDKVQLGEIDVATDEDIMEVFNNVFGKE